MPKLKATLPTAPQETARSTTTASEADTIPSALANFDKLPDAAHVRLTIVAPLFGTSPATVWRWVKSGRLPAPRKLGPNTTAWNVGELRAARMEA